MGGSKPKDPSIAADNLFSQDIVELGFGICEGTIWGLKDGLKSLFVNEQPVVSETGEYNFQDLAISIRQGYMDDTPVKYLGGGESSLINSSAGVSLPPSVPRIIQTPPSLRGQIKAIDVRIAINRLYAGNGKDVFTSSVLFRIGYRKVGSLNWRYVLQTTDSLITRKRRLANLRQQAEEQGLDFDTMTDDQQKEFELKNLKEMKNIVSVDLENITKDVELELREAATTVNVDIARRQGIFVEAMLRRAAIDKWNNLLEQKIESMSFSEVLSTAIVLEGKTSAGYIVEYNLPIFDSADSEDDWEVKVERLSKALTPEQQKFSGKVISLDSIATISNTEKTYPKTATCHIVAQHTDRFDAVPDFSAELHGFMCDIPVNYNGFTKTWAGIWNGTFKKGWTNNNALIARELIMNRDWGKRSGEPQLRVDNTSLIEAINYCDENVPDLKGELKPRHTFNESVGADRDLDEYLKYVLGSFHAACREQFGVYYFFIDRPKPAKFFVCEETALHGSLSYYRSDLSSRFNTMKVVFANADNNYQEDRRVVVDEDSVALNGIIPYSYQSVGATNLSEAIRQAVYLMYTNKEETTFATFSQPRLGHVINLYDHYYIFDKNLDWGWGTRISSYDADTKIITLRDPLVELSSGVAYQVYMHTQTGILQLSAQSINAHQLYILDTTEGNVFPDQDDVVTHSLTSIANPPLGISGGVYGSPKTFRILSVEQGDSADVSQGELFTFKGAVVSELKYQAIDNINDPELVNFKYNNLDMIYRRDRIPSQPYNAKVWLDDAVNELGQSSYGISFNIDDPAHLYKVMWVNKNTGETRETILYDTIGLLMPAFLDVTFLKLKITPFNKAGQAGESLIMDDLTLSKKENGGLPVLLSVEYNEATQSMRFTFTAADFGSYTTVDYSLAFYSWSNPLGDSPSQSYTAIENGVPKNYVLGLPMDVTETYVDVPYVGEGEYRLKLRFVAQTSTNLGYFNILETPLWAYYGDGSGSLPIARYPEPEILEVKSYLSSVKSYPPNTIPDVDYENYGNCYVKIVFKIPNFSNYPKLSTGETGDPLHYPLIIMADILNNGNWELVYWFGTAYPVSGQPAGTFELYFDGAGLADEGLEGDMNKVGGKIRLRTSDRRGNWTAPEWRASVLDSDWVIVTVPAVVTGFNPEDVYSSGT